MKPTVHEHKKINFKSVSKKLFLLLLTTFTLSCCHKDDLPKTELEKLPPATTVGANTVGCLVNGEVYLPKEGNPFGPPATVCFYQFLNNIWRFSLGFSNDMISNSLRNINISSKNIQFQQGIIYQLKFDNENSAYASYGIAGTPQYYTSNTITGELKITKLDQVNSIISGSFWFDGINNNGQIIHITEGRFDMQYTQ